MPRVREQVLQGENSVPGSPPAHTLCTLEGGVVSQAFSVPEPTAKKSRAPDGSPVSMLRSLLVALCAGSHGCVVRTEGGAVLPESVSGTAMPCHCCVLPARLRDGCHPSFHGRQLTVLSSPSLLLGLATWRPAAVPVAMKRLHLLHMETQR